MSTERFITLLQEILTMVDKNDMESVTKARNALSAIVELAFESQKANAITLRVMRRAESMFDSLVSNADDFSGKPGDYLNNNKKRKRLLAMLSPGC